MFTKMKGKWLRSQRFTGDDELQTTVISWLKSQKAEIYAEKTDKFLKRYDKYLNEHDEYVEKQSGTVPFRCK